MKIKKLRRLLFALPITGLLIGTATMAAKGGKGGGKPPNDDPPPPSQCTDAFPSFLYSGSIGGRNNGVPATFLASEDGCRTELVIEGVAVLSSGHLLPDSASSSGAIIWREQLAGGSTVIRRMQYNLDANDDLILGAPIDILPESGELGPGEAVSYFNLDLWKDVETSSTFASVIRRESLDGTPSAYDWMIYEIDESGGVVGSKLMLENAFDPESLSEFSGYGCPGDVIFPHQTPGCYSMDISGTVWHPSGESLLIRGEQGEIGELPSTAWSSYMRAEVVKRDQDDALLPLEQWSLGDLEMVIVGAFSTPADYSEPSAVGVPQADATDPALLGVTYIDRTGRHTVAAHTVLNADTCIDEYAAYSDGRTFGPVDPALWISCAEPGFVVSHLTGRFTRGGFQSPEIFLDRQLSNRGDGSIYRRYITGVLAGTSELLVENGEAPATGL
jgi:hypothetical protein